MTNRKTLTRILFRLGLPLLSVCGPLLAASPSDRVNLSDSVPSVRAAARSLGRLASATPMTVTLTLPLRHQAELEDLLRRLTDPADLAYGHYLTPSEFAARFSPTQVDYDTVAQYARDQGLTVTGVHRNRLLLEVAGPASNLETAFAVHLNRYQAANGRIFHAPDGVPSIAHAVAGLVTGVTGLSNAAVRRPQNLRANTARGPLAQPPAGSGPMGGRTPQDIKVAYGMSGLSLTGSGQTLALFELDGYNLNDITTYENQFSLPHIPLQNTILNGANGAAGDDSDEVTLDIEMQIALASGASKILVYETGNTDGQVLAGYSRIAEDDIAKQVSTSWGLDEPDSANSTLQSESTIFEQMAAQGQTIYAAAGDDGAYDTGSQHDGVAVDDPASQPYVCGVGGTTLTTSGAGGSYVSETTWNTGSVANGAGGGGISSVWPIPSWQQAAITSASGASTSMRNVPDVSLNGDPNVGYAIYTGGEWAVYGGTSCTAPLWSGFTALVNQQRATNGLAPLGQINPVLYPLLASARYAADFHDIADGSTNLYYSAVTGYDDATGLGTLNGAALLADLTSQAAASTHVLWTNTSGQNSLWNYNTSTGSFTQTTYGPFAGWTAKAIADGSDGLTRVLWDNTSGQVSLWNLNNAISGGSFTQHTFGPYSGWTATALSAASATTHILWNNVSGQVSLWNYAPSSGSFSQSTYGPYSGWSAVAIADGSDGLTRVLWDKTDGTVSLWSLNNTTGSFTQNTFGPYSGWTAKAVSVNSSNTTHILWTNTNHQASLWNENTSTGSFTQTTYGPYSGWSAVGLADGADGQTRLLWDNTSGQSSIWSVNSSGSLLTQFSFGPYSGWTATALGAAPS